MNLELQRALADAVKSSEHDSSSAPTENATVLPEQQDNDDTTVADVSQGTFQELPTEQPVRQLIDVKPLNEKAILVTLKRGMYRPYISDVNATQEYGAGTVNKHLFDGRDNLVKRTVAKFTAVYTYVNDNNVPWAVGQRMLNMLHWNDFTTGLRALVDDAYASVDTLCNNWDSVWRNDLARIHQIGIAKGNPNLAKESDYPDVDDLRGRFSIDVQYSPIPKVDDFDPRFGMSEEEKSSLQRQLDDVQTSASNHVIEQMIKPLSEAVKKLSVPIGTDGSVFRDSLIDNMVDVSVRMDRVCLTDDPVIRQQITELNRVACGLAADKEAIRHMPSARSQAKNDIESLMGRMKGLVL